VASPFLSHSHLSATCLPALVKGSYLPPLTVYECSRKDGLAYLLPLITSPPSLPALIMSRQGGRTGSFRKEGWREGS
jgi:hypothetical protein